MVIPIFRFVTSVAARICGGKKGMQRIGELFEIARVVDFVEQWLTVIDRLLSWMIFVVGFEGGGSNVMNFGIVTGKLGDILSPYL